MKRLMVVVIALLPLGASAQIRPGDVVRHLPPQAEMEALASSLGFGARRADSTRPQPTTSGFGDGLHGFYQCFARGCVYYTPDTGVQAVSGPIFTRWGLEGYERGRLGFPIAARRPCAPDSSGAAREYQNFEGGAITARGSDAASPTTVHGSRIGASGNCNVGTPMTTEREAARFRVTVNGIECHQPTNDDSLQRDGVGDEVSVDVFAIFFSVSEYPIGQPSHVTPAMGDTNGFPRRVRAGSGHSLAGGNGGFIERDRFPSSTPWSRTTEPQADRLPLIAWEGTLVRGQNAAVLLPVVWEVDDPVGTLFNDWTRALAATSADSDLNAHIRTMIGGHTAPFGNDARRLFDGVQMRKSAAGPMTRPVGMDDRGDYWAYRPPLQVLTYERASTLASSANDGLPRGVWRVTFRDANELRGFYTLYFQIEMLP